MANALRTPSLAPNVSGGNLLEAPMPNVNIARNFLPDGKLKGSGWGKAMASVAKGLNDVYQVQAQATVKQMDNRFSESVSDALYDPDKGYFNLQGKAAVDAMPNAINAVRTGFQSAQEGIDDPFVKRVYNRATGDRLQEVENQITRHYNKAVKDWNINESLARITNLGNMGILDVESWNEKDGAYSKTHDAVINELRGLAIDPQLMGIDEKSAQYTDYMLQGTTEFHVGLLDTFLAKERIGDAKGYLAKYRSEIDPRIYVKYMDKLNDLAERMQNRAMRQAAKNAASGAGGSASDQIAKIRAAWIDASNKLEEDLSTGKITEEDYFAKKNQLDNEYNQATKGISDADTYNKKTKDGKALRFQESVIETRYRQYGQAINEGSLVSLDQAFSAQELQQMDEYGLTKYAENLFFNVNPAQSKLALTAAKNIEDPNTPEGQAEFNEHLKSMNPQDRESANAWRNKKLMGSKTPFDSRVKEYAMQELGITDGKMPKQGTPEYTQLLQTEQAYRDRVSVLVQEVPQAKLNEVQLMAVLNNAKIERTQRYTKKKGMLWDSENTVGIDPDTARSIVTDGAYIKLTDSSGTEYEIPADLYEQWLPQITADIINTTLPINTKAFNDKVAVLMSAKMLDYKQRGTVETQAILGQ